MTKKILILAMALTVSITIANACIKSVNSDKTTSSKEVVQKAKVVKNEGNQNMEDNKQEKNLHSNLTEKQKKELEDTQNKTFKKKLYGYPEKKKMY